MRQFTVDLNRPSLVYFCRPPFRELALLPWQPLLIIGANRLLIRCLVPFISPAYSLLELNRAKWASRSRPRNFFIQARKHTLVHRHGHVAVCAQTNLGAINVEPLKAHLYTQASPPFIDI